MSMEKARMLGLLTAKCKDEKTVGKVDLILLCFGRCILDIVVTRYVGRVVAGESSLLD